MNFIFVYTSTATTKSFCARCFTISSKKKKNRLEKKKQEDYISEIRYLKSSC